MAAVVAGNDAGVQCIDTVADVALNILARRNVRIWGCVFES